MIRTLALALVTIGCSRDPAPSGPSAQPSISASVSASASSSASASASASAPPSPCKADTDCVLVGVQPPSCCSRCGQAAMTKKQADEANRACREIAATRKDYFASCPHLSCTCTREKALCRDGRCTVASEPCR